MSKSERQRTAREKLAEERRRHEQRSRRIRTTVVGFGAFAVAAVLVSAVVIAKSGEDLPTTFKGGTAPTSRQADQSIVMAKPGVTAPVLEVFEDFQCPSCKNFEDTVGATVKKLAAEGAAKVVYRPFHLFGQFPEPTRGNSRRAVNASLCAPADRWLPYHDVLYKNQPDETDPGFSNDALIRWAKDVGITGAGFEACVTKEGKLQQMEQVTKYATVTRKLDSTPTLFLNGTKLDSKVTFSSAALESAVRAAARTAPATRAATTPASPAARNKAQP